MSTTIRDVLVKITTDNSGLSQGLDAAKSTLKGFAVAAGAALGAATVAFAGVTMAAIKSSREIERFARVSNASTTEFQRWTAAAGTAGIATEKMADILKDVNDRVGDFMATGGGPMADFFENIAPKVGVTADMFRKLSGPQALQLYVDTLQKAGASQQDLTFYMEAMAGDATLLLPLLRNNGAELNRLADAAQRAGAILSEETLAALRDANTSVDQINTSFKGFTNQLIAAVAPALAVAAATFADMSAAGGPLSQAVDSIAEAFSGLAQILASPEFIGAATSAMTTLINLTASAAQGMVWLSQNLEIVTASAGAAAVAFAAMGGPLWAIGAALAVAVASFSKWNSGLSSGKTNTDNLKAAQDALNVAMGGYNTAAPSARDNAKNLAAAYVEQAKAALTAAEAEIALMEAEAARFAAAPAEERGLLGDMVDDNNKSALDDAVSTAETLRITLENARRTLAAISVEKPRIIVGTPPGEGDSGDTPDIPGVGSPGQTGSGESGLTTRLDALKQELATEREILDEWYTERQDTLAEALATRQITEEEYRQQRERLEAEHAERMKAIDNTSMDTKLGIMQHVFGGLASLMDAGNKKLFNIGKAASLANAAIDGYEAAISSYKHGAKIGGPALGAVYAGISLARTAAMMAKISSQSYGGGSSGGASGGGGSAATPEAAPPPIQRVDVVWNGPQESSVGMQAVLDVLNDAARRGLRVDARLVSA